MFSVAVLAQDTWHCAIVLKTAQAGTSTEAPAFFSFILIIRLFVASPFELANNRLSGRIVALGAAARRASTAIPGGSSSQGWLLNRAPS